MDFDYAYNYWRKIFVENSDGYFNKDYFDEWFHNGTENISGGFGHFPTIDKLGSKEHFDTLMRQAFIEMLKACASGRFSK